VGVLDGVKVVDFSRLAPGPYCTMLLADMGADVVRVDRVPLPRGGAPLVGDIVGRGKRSIALNLKQAEGAEVALRLAGWADVLVEGFRPGVMERLGLGPDVVLTRNSRIIYARITGWGQTGPLAQRAGHDINYIAVAGALGLFGRAGEPPVPPVNVVADFAGGGMFAALGILGALLERERSGKGQVIDAAMVDGAANLTAFFAQAIQSGTWGPRGTNALDTGAHFYEVYETSDGGHIAVGAVEPEFYAQLIEGLGLAREDLPSQMDSSSWPEMKGRLATIFQTKTREEWTRIFECRDACVCPVLEPREAARHRYNTERDTYISDANGVLQPAPGPRLSRTPGSLKHPAPHPGEHTREVLEQVAFTADEIDSLVAGRAAEAE